MAVGAAWLFGYELLYNGLVTKKCGTIGADLAGALANATKTHYPCDGGTPPPPSPAAPNQNSPAAHFGDPNNFVGPVAGGYEVFAHGHRVGTVYPQLTVAEAAYNAAGGPPPG